MSKIDNPRLDDRRERARTLLHILTTMLDRTPGLREALPRLQVLECALPLRGLSAMNDAPLPTFDEVHAVLVRLLPRENATMRESRAHLLSSLDRRKKARNKSLPTFVSNRDVFAGEATLSDFMDALEVEAGSPH